MKLDYMSNEQVDCKYLVLLKHLSIQCLVEMKNDLLM